MKTFSFENATSAEAFQISPTDTNYFAILFDPKSAPTDNIFVVEIFNVGGATPPNSHSDAHEFFYVLHGEGTAASDGDEMPIKKGDALLLNPGSVHIVKNTGTSKLYTLTVMTPNQDFSELIRSGQRISLDEEDLRVLQGL
ncbi:cupin domain-containing protein [Rhizobium sp. CG4]|mgnify:CR=1 FL=1|jgi:mannose-6-phosphate isomerase-like protein (cupin superfamily)|uniref:cupin domain-containing protein n=1 Tax=Rhizobium/Agrobacterium group TaxID=227290 RepID=UPI001784A25A|nr:MULTISPECIES: cupin domain-containing protein [Rhizobium/Agrobacterium group]MBD9387966.1 cupin domain-containing protein [Agrobacterium sp. AGB01]MCM2457876.1 cupin domain-containing protein [Rhizobium sp. CG4]MCS4243351.1 mannose-6-phosphate isomerase-like protein (cupin superfamily) [Rhizobium sp. BIGb0125]